MKKSFYIFLTIIIALSAVFLRSTTEPRMLTVRHYHIKNSELKGIKIVFVSDFHVLKNQEKRLDKIIEKINTQKPDIVLLGGDYIKADYPEKSMDIKTIAKHLSQIKPKYTTLAVLGNHDYLYGMNRVKYELEKNNIKVLMNENVPFTIGQKTLYIAGIEDFWEGHPNINKSLKSTKEPVILLSHNPDVFPQIPPEVDLTLSGHTHGGQVVLPIFGAPIVPSDYGNKYAQGFVTENNKKMIVTKGLGTSILPIRLNCLPEIIVIDFI